MNEKTTPTSPDISWGVITETAAGSFKGDMRRMKMTFEEAVSSVKIEREYQDFKWGSLEEKNQSVAGYLVILEKELEEAKNGWMKNKTGKDSALAEIRQIAAVALACIQQHGIEGN